MARRLCAQCQRPICACICAFISKTYNKTPVLVLQHPSEVKQSKGTVALLQRSLHSCRVLIGEDFSDNDELIDLLAQNQGLLLYPGEQAQDLLLSVHQCDEEDSQSIERKPPLLIILDGTWKKAYRMYRLSKNLHSLTQVCLPDVIANKGKYLIRKVAKKNALSSLEATCYALALLEGELATSFTDNKVLEATTPIDCGPYQALLNKFSLFNQFQLSFRK